MADGKVIIESQMDNSGLDKGLSEMQSKLSNVSDKMMDVGKTMTKGLTVPIAGAATGAIKMAADFDDSMRQVKATMGDNLGSSTQEAEENFARLNDQARELGSTTAFSASDASGAMQNLAQMGYDTNEILAATPNILDAASASGLELDFVAGTISSSMNQFGVEVDENGDNVQRFGDVMVRAGQISGTSMDEIGQALEYVGSSASEAGMDIEQTSAYLGVLGDAGLSGSKAGNALNAMFRDMKQEVQDGNLEFGEFSVAMYDSNGEMRDMTDIMTDLESGLEGMSQEQKDAAINAVFGSQSQNALNKILGQGTDQLREYEGELNNSKGTAAEASEEMEAGLGGAFRNLKSAMEGAAEQLGSALAPTIQKVVELVSKLFQWFGNLDESTLEMIGKIGLLVAAIGPLLMLGSGLITGITFIIAKLASVGAVIWKVISVIGSLASFLGGPLTIAIGLVVAAGTLVYKNWEQIKEFGISMWEGIKEAWSTAVEFLKELWVPVGEFFSDLWEGIRNITTSVWDGIKSALETVWETIKSVIESATDIVRDTVQTVWGTIESVTSSIWDSIVGAISIVWENIKNTIDTTLSVIKNIVDTIWNAIKGIINTLLNGIRSIIESIWNGIQSIISSIMSTIQSLISDVWNAISGIVSSVVGKIKSTISSIFNSLSGIVSGAMSNVKSAVSDGMSNALATITNRISDFANAGKNIVTSIADGIRGAASKVTDAMGNIAQRARDMLPFSPAKEGPLKDLDKLDFGGPIEDSIRSAIPNVQAEMNHLVSAKGLEVSSSTIASQAGSQRANVELIKGIKAAVASNTSGNSSKQGEFGVVVQIGERTILDTITDGINRESRISGKPIIKV